MPSHDLNDLLTGIKGKTSKIQKDIFKFYEDYENIFREAHRVLTTEQVRVGGTEGLEEFRYLVQLLRRNRDITSSMVRTVKGIRPITQFSFVDDEEQKQGPKEPEAKKKKPVNPAPDNFGSDNFGPEGQEGPEIVNSEAFDTLTIEEEKINA